MLDDEIMRTWTRTKGYSMRRIAHGTRHTAHCPWPMPDPSSLKVSGATSTISAISFVNKQFSGPRLSLRFHGHDSMTSYAIKTKLDVLRLGHDAIKRIPSWTFCVYAMTLSSILTPHLPVNLPISSCLGSHSLYRYLHGSCLPRPIQGPILLIASLGVSPPLSLPLLPSLLRWGEGAGWVGCRATCPLQR
jgi:hypothetical protein